MSLPLGLAITWPQFFAFMLLALVGAFLAELLVGNSPRFGFIGSVALAILGAWLFVNIPVEISVEPRLEDWPVARAILGALVLVVVFAFFRKQGVTR